MKAVKLSGPITGGGDNTRSANKGQRQSANGNIGDLDNLDNDREMILVFISCSDNTIANTLLR